MAKKETPAWILLGRYAGVLLLFAGPVFVSWASYQVYKFRKHIE